MNAFRGQGDERYIPTSPVSITLMFLSRGPFQTEFKKNSREHVVEPAIMVIRPSTVACLCFRSMSILKPSESFDCSALWSVQRLPMTFSDDTTTVRVQWFMSPICPTSRRISNPAHPTPVNAVEMLMNRSGQSVSQSPCLLLHPFTSFTETSLAY